MGGNVAGEMMVRRRAALLEAQVDGELVALHVDQGTCYGFNLTAARIWALIEQPVSFAELRQALLGEFDVDAETCDRELMELLRELERDGLIELAGTA